MVLPIIGFGQESYGLIDIHQIKKVIEEKDTLSLLCVSGNCIDGYGVIEDINGDSMYVGYFKDGFFHGSGTYAWEHSFYSAPGNYGEYIDTTLKVLYEGQFKNGEYHGKGNLWLCNYVGFPVPDENWGRAYSTEQWHPPREYNGSFKLGQFDGEGSFTFSDGNILKGTFTKNEIDNGSTLIYKNGNRYTGNFKPNLSKTYPNNDIRFYGSFRLGENLSPIPHGNGVMIYNNGSKYDGEFREGKRHGIGEFTSKSGKTIFGQWIEDEFKR